jgi:hypothetical protein
MLSNKVGTMMVFLRWLRYHVDVTSNTNAKAS